ncbi:MAG: hypothetical protein ACI9OJ_004027 [Myxococcota bacterium]|jgi:hypothetical protein
MKTLASLIIAAFALGLVPFEASAQAPGTLRFTKGWINKKPNCYFKKGNESSKPAKKTFASSDSVCFRVYAKSPFIGPNPSFSLYVNGKFYKGANDTFDFEDNTSGMWNLKTAIGMFKNKPLPRGRHCMKVSTKKGGSRVVVAEGCYNVP